MGQEAHWDQMVPEDLEDQVDLEVHQHHQDSQVVQEDHSDLEVLEDQHLAIFLICQRGWMAVAMRTLWNSMWHSLTVKQLS